MAIIHYDILFKKHAPTLEQLKEKLDARMGLNTHLAKDALEGGHAWPHLGMVKESGTLECEECDDSDMEVTVGSHGVRLTCVPDSLHPYFLQCAIAALVDLGGAWGAKLPSMVSFKWSDLSAAQKQVNH